MHRRRQTVRLLLLLLLRSVRSQVASAGLRSAGLRSELRLRSQLRRAALMKKRRKREVLPLQLLMLRMIRSLCLPKLTTMRVRVRKTRRLHIPLSLRFTSSTRKKMAVRNGRIRAWVSVLFSSFSLIGTISFSL